MRVHVLDGDKAHSHTHTASSYLSQVSQDYMSLRFLEEKCETNGVIHAICHVWRADQELSHDLCSVYYTYVCIQ